MANRGALEAESLVARRGGRSWLGLPGWILLAAAAGAIGGIASRNADTFYGALAKPAWAPPGWLFGPVWSTLYVLMGVAAPSGRTSRQFVNAYSTRIATSGSTADALLAGR